MENFIRNLALNRFLFLILILIFFQIEAFSQSNPCGGGNEGGGFGCAILEFLGAKDPGNEFNIPRLHAVDPNEISGPLGYDTAQWVSIYDNLGYTIFYENDPDFATAPAQIVEIRLPVDPNLNIYSVRLGDFGFGFFNFSVPENSTFYQKRLDVIDSLNVYVDITAGIDVIKNEVFWIFESIDPLTNLPPEDALTGFLPVNDTTVTLYNDTLPKRGEGYVNYTIYPRTNLQTGDTVKAQASIIFDINAPLLTNTWVNLIDALPPTSQMDTLTMAVVPGNKVNLAWQGEDDTGGVGVEFYDLFVSKDTGAYLLIAENVDTTFYEFQGSEGSQYYFYTRATDYVGNVEGEKYTLDEQVILGELDSIALHHPAPDTTFCETDSLTIEWEVFGDVERVDIFLSTDTGQTFPIVIALDTIPVVAPFKFPLNGLDGSGFVLQIADTLTDGFTILSDTFSVFGIDSTLQEVLVCDPNEVGLVYQTFSNQNGCDSVAATNSVLDNIPPTIACHNNQSFDLAANGTVMIDVSDINNNSSDNCELDTLFLDQNIFNCSQIGSNAIKLYAIDAAGNIDSCSVNITINEGDANCGCQETDLVINDDPIAGGTYLAFNTITSAGKIAKDSMVIFQAPDSIILLAGFGAEAGSDFVARIGDCPIDNLQEEIPNQDRIQARSRIEDIALKVIPNPFKYSTSIHFDLPESGEIQLSIHSLTGALTKWIVNKEWYDAGNHQLEIAGHSLAAGTYFLRLEIEGQILTKKLVLIK